MSHDASSLPAAGRACVRAGNPAPAGGCDAFLQLQDELVDVQHRYDAVVANLEREVRVLQRMEPLGELVSGIAHDFNNLLAVILGSSNLLLDSLPEESVERRDAECIREAAEQASWLTKQLLMFVRREAAEPTVLELNGVIERTERMLRRVVGEEIELAVSLDHGAGWVRAADGEIEQVVMNLVANARDAIEGCGRISIRTRWVPASRRGTDGGCSDGFTELSVADTGCGMPPEIIAQAFEPFFTTKARGQGTGLGLSTCAAIVRRIGGQIRADSKRGRGTVITITLPTVNPASDASTTAYAVRTAPGHETILVIEDDERVAVLVSRILERAGYRVLAARSGQDALRLCEERAGAIDLVLSDVVVPDLNGPEVVRRMRESSVHAKVLFMSGHTNHRLLQDGVLHAANGFIQKPFGPQALARKVRDILDAPA